MVDGHWRRIGVELARYQKAGLAAMVNKRYYNIAPDASKMGKRTYLLCPSLKPSLGQRCGALRKISFVTSGSDLVYLGLGGFRDSGAKRRLSVHENSNSENSVFEFREVRF